MRRRSIQRFGPALALLTLALVWPAGVAGFTLDPTALDFGNVVLNDYVSEPISITLDSGDHVGGASASGNYDQFSTSFSTCAGATGPTTCTIYVTFHPTVLGTSSETLFIDECDASDSNCTTLSIDISGTGYIGATATPSSVDFGDVPINTTATRDVTLTFDSGWFISTVSLPAGPFSFDFGTCTGTTATCTAHVSFTPATLGSASAVLVVYEHKSVLDDPIDIPLTGTGVVVGSVAPANVDFGDVATGTTSSRDLAVTVDSGFHVTAGGTSGSPFGLDLGSCAGFVGPGTCSASVSFTPAGVGSAAGTASVSTCSNPASGGCAGILLDLTVPLAGVGVQPLTITTATLPNGTVGATYPGTTLQASGGTGADTWSIASGALPPGLSLDAASGVISGTPSASGSFMFTVRVTDSGTPVPQTATAQLSIAVTGYADLALAISATPKPVSYPKPVTVTITLQNLGPDTAGATIDNTLPTGSQFVSYSATQGTCTTPPVGSTGTMVCSPGPLASGASMRVSVVIDPTIKKGTITDSAIVTPDEYTVDPITANDTATVSIQVK